MAPGEICILIYLSYILYISKFFIPLQWPHASFMDSSAVFAGQIPTHFTCHAAARLFHLGCVGWMKNLLSSVVKFSFLTPPSFRHCQCQESSGLCWTLKIAREASLWPGKGCFVEGEWLTQLGEYGNDVLMLPTGQVKSRQIYLWSAFNKTSSSWGRVLKKVKTSLTKLKQI